MNHQEYVPCPHCGEDIRSSAKFCRHCGSSDSDGWSNETDQYEDPDFDYDDFVQEEFSDDVSYGYTNTKTKPVWRFVAASLLLLIFLYAYMMVA